MNNTEQALREALQEALKIFDWLERRGIYQDLGVKSVHAKMRAAIAAPSPQPAQALPPASYHAALASPPKAEPAPAADRQAREMITREVKNQLSLRGFIDRTLDAICANNEPDAIHAELVALAHRAVEETGDALAPAPAAGPVLTEPLQVFSKGPWLFEETGQRFTGAELDEAAFKKYRAAATHPAKGGEA